MPAPADPLPPPRRRRRVSWGMLGLATVLLLFAGGVVRLLQLRFDVGDVYPPYSTLRSDPLGAKALFDSLDDLPGLRAERSLRPLPMLGMEPLRPAGYDNGEAKFTCFYLGADAGEWPFLLPPDALERLETIMRRGGRVVITFRPTATRPTVEGLAAMRARQERSTAVGEDAGPQARRIAAQSRSPDLIQRWNIDFDRSARAPDPAAPTPPGAVGSHPTRAREIALPDPALAARGGADAAFASGGDAVRWHSVLDFRPGDSALASAAWRRIYERDGRPVIVARSFGLAGGELILASDSYFLSNEGLRDDPHPGLLAALVGPGRRLIFDETHLGISEEPGLMTLARRYRLQGAIAALALLAALFVWRNVVSLVPAAAPGGPESGSVVRGHSADEGYLNLLRRSIRAGDLPAVCVDQWQSTGSTGHGDARSPGQAAGQRSVNPAASARLQAVLAAEAARPARQRSSVAVVYRALCAAARQKG